MTRKGVGSLGQLRGRIDSGVGGGKRISGGGVPSGSRGVGVGRSRWEYPVLWLLQNLLRYLFTTVVSSALLL